MKKENIDEFIKNIKNSYIIIQNYLYDYLREDISMIMEEYEIDEENEDNVEIVGYKYIGDDTIQVFIIWNDEINESGIGFEKINIDINDFKDYLNKN